MRRIGNLVVRIVSFIPRLLRRLIRRRPKPAPEAPSSKEPEERLETAPLAEAPPSEETLPTKVSEEAPEAEAPSEETPPPQDESGPGQPDI